MLVVDPSSGSEKSKCGYAYFESGDLVTSGIVDIDHRLTIDKRLQNTYDWFAANYNQPDLLVIEEIRGRLSHAYLLWSVGTIIAAVRASHMLEMNIGTWKRRASVDYVKSDSEDARQMGLVTVTLAEEYDDEQE
jgi:hypothetical protein